MNLLLHRSLLGTTIAAALTLAPASVFAAPTTYAFDTVHSRLTFYVSHLGFSNSVGQLSVAPGTFVFDTADWSKGQVTATLPADSLAFGDAKWDAHIKGADILIADTQYTPKEIEIRRGWGHGCFRSVVALADTAGVKNLYMTHHDPAHNDDFMDQMLTDAKGMVPANSKMNVFAAIEGQHVRF